MYKHQRTNHEITTLNNTNDHSNDHPQNVSITNKPQTPYKIGPTVNIYNKDRKNINKSLSPHPKPESFPNKNVITTTATTTTTTTTTTTMTTNIHLPVESNIEIIYDKSPFKKTKEELVSTPPKRPKMMSGLKAAHETNTSYKQPNLNPKTNNSSTGKLKPKTSIKSNVINPPQASGANNRYMVNYYNSKHSNSGHSSNSNQDNGLLLNSTAGISSKNVSQHSTGSTEITCTASRILNSSSGTPQNSRVMKIRKAELPNHEPTKFSFKKNGVVKAYAVNTNQGIVRNYNEDRVSIILNIMKPIDRQNEFWPRCSFFGVYDGHGGVTCADFLRDNLHHFVVKDENFPYNPKEALKGGFYEAERQFCELAQRSLLYKHEGGNASIETFEPNNETEGKAANFDKSGSCCIVLLVVGDTCYISNVGDSRAVMSVELGRKAVQLSRDHKPQDEIEYKRIVEAGGKIYQTKVQTYNNTLNDSNTSATSEAYLIGPYRVLPGRLSVFI